MSDYSKLQALLDDHMSFPEDYSFKFITKEVTKTQLLDVLSDHSIAEKPSRNGKYTSITSKLTVNSSKEIIEIYQEVSKIEGIITL